MTSRAMCTPGGPGVRAAGEGGCGPSSSFAGLPADVIRRVAQALASLWQGCRSTGRPRHPRHDGWSTAAQESYLRGADDVHDLERRQRSWDRDESTAYSLSGWR